MASIYAKPNGGPWSSDDDEVRTDGYESYNGFRTASIGNGPSVDGLNVNAPSSDRGGVGGLVNGHNEHLVRSRDSQ